MPTSPSSPNLKLQGLREELILLNHRFIEFVQERRQLVALIQQSKRGEEAIFPSYDAAREKQLFLELSAQLQPLSSHELLAFSLLMEGHAGAPEKYPAWSEGVHLLEAPSRHEHRMNPLLLKILRPTTFAMLRLAPSFSFLRSI